MLVQLCLVIAKLKIDRIPKENKENFRSKLRVNGLMIGKNEEVHKETKQILREILLKYQYEVIPKKSQEDVQNFVPKFLGMPSLGGMPKLDEPREQISQ